MCRWSCRPKRQRAGPVALDHLEVYAVTASPGLLIPANRDLLMPQYLVGQIPIKPPPDDDSAADETAEGQHGPVPARR